MIPSIGPKKARSADPVYQRLVILAPVAKVYGRHQSRDAVSVYSFGEAAVCLRLFKIKKKSVCKCQHSLKRPVLTSADADEQFLLRSWERDHASSHQFNPFVQRPHNMHSSLYVVAVGVNE